ncbi:calcium/sodium antiporter [Patescibacteria group bacterium]|nr:calcium/sodium antiporter [Patescibacteria group bacterium]
MTLELVKWFLVFALALFVLIKSADFFTEYSEKLGKILNVPQFIIGVTIIALGTSLPELMTSIIATLRDETAIVSANVVGSNIANILLIGGFSSILAGTIAVEKSLIKIDLPLLIGVTAILITTLWDGQFTFLEGIIMLLTYGIYVIYNYNEHNSTKEKFSEMAKHTMEKKEKPSPKIFLVIVLSCVGIFLGADYTVKAVTEISSILNIASAAIAVSTIAIGTSLPELFVSYKAIKKKNFELVVGNIIGSNIFNATIVMAIPSFISPLYVQSSIINIAVPFLIIATILFAFSGIERKIFSFEGALYGLIYLIFIGQLYNFI